MEISWHQEVRNFKSPLRVVGAFLLRSRETLRANVQELREQVQRLTGQLEQQTRYRLREQQKIAQLNAAVAQLREQLRLAKSSVNLPEDPPLGTHGYGARMIALSHNLARRIGFRAAADVMRIFFDWLNVPTDTPQKDTIRNWSKRLGIALMQKPMAAGEVYCLMADHSNQIGNEKLLLALAVNTANLPEQGTALSHDDVRVLAVKPGSQWKTDDMRQEYESLAQQFGDPRMVLVDGAPELRDGAKSLAEKENSNTIVGRDFKHFAANVLKSILNRKDSRFQEVVSSIGSTRALIQQTELAHLVPPTIKQKARFMNLQATIRWMTLVVWLLKHPEAEGRQGISEERFQEKLGWVQAYEADIATWQECQQVLSKSLTFINQQYLYKGASKDLRKAIGDGLNHSDSQELAERLIQFVSDSESQLRDGERLPCSTEILESLFGRYKQMERQHSKSGFTSLVACIPALLRPTNVDEVCECFTRVSANDARQWISDNFKSTVLSRRHATYKEHHRATALNTTT